MRTIKFREYRGDGRWHYWGLMDEGKFIGPCSPNSIAQQFTGLFDRHGNDIYEGDILSSYNHLKNGKPNYAPVVFENGAFVWWAKPLGFDEENVGEPIGTDWCVVVGNIYQNAELFNRAVGV